MRNALFFLLSVERVFELVGLWHSVQVSRFTSASLRLALHKRHLNVRNAKQRLYWIVYSYVKSKVFGFSPGLWDCGERTWTDTNDIVLASQEFNLVTATAQQAQREREQGKDCRHWWKHVWCIHGHFLISECFAHVCPSRREHAWRVKWMNLDGVRKKLNTRGWNIKRTA